jgi:dihydrofolate synthase/folylpolyglutamate synthase
MLASILQEAGYKVGLYTSPHLKDFRERIKINGQMIQKEEVVNFIKTHQTYIENNSLSFFELTVAMAFEAFAKSKVDLAIVEVGLGGRLDSTNIIKPEVSLITNIGFDHMQFLGDTLPKIAYEKAGIIKPNTPVVISEYQEATWGVFMEKAKQENAPIYLAAPSSFKSDLKGNYQYKNINGVVEVIKRLEGFIITQEHLVNGLLSVVKNTNLLGRWQIIQQNPKIILDTAHNKEGLSYTLKQLEEEPKEQLHMVIGMVSDKDIDGVIQLLPKGAIYYTCAPKIDRALNQNLLLEKLENAGLKATAHESVQKALEAAKSKATVQDVIYVGGSTFVVAEVV